ncbi:hypothetical protein WN943_026726 [Citrus x changshan-huyou]
MAIAMCLLAWQDAKTRGDGCPTLSLRWVVPIIQLILFIFVKIDTRRSFKLRHGFHNQPINQSRRPTWRDYELIMLETGVHLRLALHDHDVVLHIRLALYDHNVVPVFNGRGP